MTPRQIDHIERSFRLVAPQAEAAAAGFYARLFELDPSLRPLFRNTDIVAQGRKLMQALGFVVANLKVPDQLLPVVAAMGARHAGYGVQEAHYATVGRALIETLEGALGAGFTAEVREAWTTAYGLLAEVMMTAARPSGPPLHAAA
ncbi:globin family protein [Falsiroseomonas sp.]|uniref:globin family protein n=1 Tax=Falsiroseomonas sp. TaxID=2870721 RepID=UPI003F6E9772